MKVLRWLDDYFEAIFLIVTLFSMSIIIAVQVFFRYVLLNSISWSEEIARYLFIYMVYFGISYAVRTNRHIRVEVVLNMLPDRGRKILTIIADIFFMIFATVVTVKSGVVVGTISRLGQIAGVTGIPMGIIYSAVPVGYGMVVVRLLQNLYHKITHINAPYEEFIHRKNPGERSGVGTETVDEAVAEAAGAAE